MQRGATNRLRDVGTAGHETTAGSVVAEAGGRDPEGEEGTAGGPPSLHGPVRGWSEACQTPFWPQVKDAIQVESSSVLGLDRGSDRVNLKVSVADVSQVVLVLLS